MQISWHVVHHQENRCQGHQVVEMVDRRNVLRRMTLVEKRLVIEAGGERFYHLDNIVDMEHINAWEYG